jgi:flagellar hook-associated protein 1 FlgK
MTNFSARILGSAISALNAQQAKIAVTSNNIANVNTPGYARRTIDLNSRSESSSSSGISVGGGVEIGTLQRQTDAFLERLMRQAGGDFQRFRMEDEYLSRLEPMFSLTDEFNSIGGAFNAFFSALDDLSDNPANLELRANVVERGNDLVNSIKNTFNNIADLQTEADLRLEVEVEAVNALTTQLADLNSQIRTRESTGGVAASERDQRELLLTKLAEKISFSTTDVNDGTINVTLSNGFSLVTGSEARQLGFERSPSFAAGAIPPSLAGGALGHVVYDYSNGSGTAQIELTNILANGSGSVAGILNARGVVDVTNAGNTSAFDASGTLVEAASRVEAMARFLLTSVNQENLGFSMGDRNGGTAIFDPQSADLDGNPPGVYGLFSFDFSGARDGNGNGLPDDLGALGVDNFASLLNMAISDPRDVAAGRNVSGGVTLTVPQGDNRNVAALAAMQNTDFTFSAGNYAMTGRVQTIYDETVGYIGNQRSASKINLSVAEANQIQAQAKRDEISGVSLDEEFTNLIQHQRSFEAAARLIRIADEMMQQMVQLI